MGKRHPPVLSEANSGKSPTKEGGRRDLVHKLKKRNGGGLTFNQGAAMVMNEVREGLKYARLRIPQGP